METHVRFYAASPTVSWGETPVVPSLPPISASTGITSRVCSVYPEQEIVHGASSPVYTHTHARTHTRTRLKQVFQSRTFLSCIDAPIPSRFLWFTSALPPFHKWVVAYSSKTTALKSGYKKTGLQARCARASSAVRTPKATQPPGDTAHTDVGGEVLSATNLQRERLSPELT